MWPVVEVRLAFYEDKERVHVLLTSMLFLEDLRKESI
jgi:hypothetical protein